MKIYLENHDYLFAVEQTVMALLPEETIETVDISPDSEMNSSILISYLQVEESDEMESVAHCTIKISEKTYEGTCAFLNSDISDRGKIQFAIKESIFQTVIKFQKAPPWGNLTGVRPVKLITKLMKQGSDNLEEILRNKYHIEEKRVKLALDCGKVSQDIQNRLKDSVSVYIGIPFCPTRCHYCSFFSSDVREHKNQVQPYLEALCQEIKQTGKLLEQYHLPLTTIYVGGGTPTVLDKNQLKQLLNEINSAFSQDLLEFTVEAGRPDTITPEKLQVMEENRVTRISINPQTMNDKILENIGRHHTGEQVKVVYTCAKNRFQINTDLICGLQGDTPDGFLNSLSEVIAMNPTQITVHSLTPKKNTPLTENPSEICENISWEDTLNTAWTTLEQAGYSPYYLYRQKKIADGLENVGWSREDPSYYNVAMMEEFQTILGCGAGSMTKWIGKTGQIERLQNPKFYWDYIKNQEENLRKKEEFFAKNKG